MHGRSSPDRRNRTGKAHTDNPGKPRVLPLGLHRPPRSHPGSRRGHGHGHDHDHGHGSASYPSSSPRRECRLPGHGLHLGLDDGLHAHHRRHAPAGVVLSAGRLELRSSRTLQPPQPQPPGPGPGPGPGPRGLRGGG